MEILNFLLRLLIGLSQKLLLREWLVRKTGSKQLGVLDPPP